MFRKILKRTHDQVFSFNKQSSSFNLQSVPESPFLSLPNEILEMIFRYLSPRDIIVLQSLNIQRFSEICLALKSADFSACNTVPQDEVSAFFTRDRAAYIREINFNNVFFVQSSYLEKCIIRCKHLIKLFAYECGLTYDNILYILLHCTKIEELYWSVLIKQTSLLNNDLYYEETYNTYNNLKKLHLNFNTKTPGCFKIVCDILEKSIRIQEVCVSVSPYFTMSLYPSMSRETFVCKLPCLTNCSISFAMHCRLQYCNMYAKRLMNELLTMHHFNIAKLNEDKSDDVSLFLANYSFLQITTDSEQLNAIPSLSENSVHSLVLIMTNSKADLLNHMDTLKRVTGKKLEYLTVHTILHPSRALRLEHRDELLETFDGDFLCDIITQMTTTCLNIQVLNLAELHFDAYFTFKALHCLKRLKNLSLSACTLREPSSMDNASYSPVKEFENMVLQCTNIEKFSLHDCLLCQFGPTDDSLLPICGWHKLRHLLISKVSTFRTCSFLTRIPDSCPLFASLEIVEVGDLSVCHYYQNVTQILRKCKQLMFLRINQRSFYPSNSLFWKSVGMAKNLQGLCIATDINTVVDNKMITEAIKQLPFLHLMHVVARRVCQNFSSQIKKILSKHGVRAHKIEVQLLGNNNPFTGCQSAHFPAL